MKSVRGGVLALALSGVVVAGCGLESGGAVPLEVGPGSIQPVPELENLKMTVGSKDFSEQIILGDIIEFAMVAAGADVRDYCPAGGCHSSILLPSGSITQPNLPYSESSVLSSTSQPSSRKACSRPASSSTR